jgi:SAM-dependent methyltransferase
MDRALPPPPNEKERRRWNDPRWVARWPEREALTTSVTAYVMDEVALQPGESVLDIGCGGGGTSLIAGLQVQPKGSVTGVDISEDLLALARQRARDAGVGNVDYRLADMQLERLEVTFDVAISQFGVMFFDEPSAAFANIRSHLRPGGRLVFACWQTVDRNPWHTGRVLRPYVPAAPVPGPGKSPTSPFALGDPEETTDILDRAGFTEVAFTGFEITVDAPASAIAESSLYGFLGIKDADVDDVNRVLDRHVEQFRIGDDLYRYPLAFWVCRAEA